jgi:hypothetical protein
MSWEKLESERGNYARRNAVVVRGGKSLTITIGCELAAALRWSKRQRVDMWVGQDEHAGRLRIVADEHGAYSLLQRDRTEIGVVAKRVMPRGWPTAKQPPTIVGHLMIDGGVEIALPAWARASEGAPPAPAPSPPTAPRPAAPPPLPRQAAPSAPQPGDITVEFTQRDDALVHAVSDFYHRGINPSHATLAAAAKIQQGSISVTLARLSREARLTSDELGVRPRGKPPLKIVRARA